MNKLFSILIVFLFAAQSLAAEEISIKFHLKFGFVKGGEAEMTISDTVFNDRPAIHYHVMGKTTGLANKLYGVYDIYETYVDAETRLPVKTIRNVKEGSYRRYTETLFYHDVDSINSTRSGWRAVPDDLLDLISVFFYFVHKNPFENLQPGDAVVYPTINADKISDVSIKYLHDEKIETDVGKVDCHVLTPTVRKGKVLEKSDGVKFYLAKEEKVPVFIEFEMRVGSLKAVIQHYKIDGVEQTLH
ncbi:DUF3108 domain-containing protein [Draconibacterium sp. IB214405]|uniref:DUF3108 domain-containing protein n=1 Tax=Draconibacterium sp. IB214405 TaxID=3097352 RepID=UPI002A160385|nr:DUF3108 domain-containing protein [Draconibacterium sp. IB214405]MDX8337700.1 DUF3108 domain-containing protein [Draconibacterium sp. IB214405]